jgi:hypothetical protein
MIQILYIDGINQKFEFVEGDSPGFTPDYILTSTEWFSENPIEKWKSSVIESWLLETMGFQVFRGIFASSKYPHIEFGDKFYYVVTRKNRYENSRDGE